MISPVKKTPSRLVIIAVAVVCSLGVNTTARSQNIDANLARFSDTYSPERAYIHYDKSTYSTGETIWFKAYLMNETIPAEESKNFYIDWVDDKGVLLSHAVSPLVNSVTNGQFEIPADYKGKIIHVKAYTKWMLNFDTAFIYSKSIPIITKEPPAAGQKSAVIPSIQFFPEGGDLVQGLQNKVAFKAHDQWGRPVKVKGVVVNSKNKVEDSIRVQHDGMGYFLLTPEAGLTYSVKWKDEKSVERNAPLPKAKTNGATLQVTASGPNRIFSVKCTPDFVAENDTVHLIGTIYQRQAFRVAKATSAEAIRGSIPAANLPSGILTITLFDKNWKPIAERITYIDNKEYSFQPSMEVQRWGLNKRARNELVITVPDSLTSNLSISVTDLGIGSDSSNTIISHLLLTSEIKGQVYNPAYYFSSQAPEVSQHLDLVMLTHGWRRFKWDDIVSGKIPKPVYPKDTSYLSLSGTVMGVLPGQIGKDATVALMIRQKDAEAKMVLAPIDAKGTFNDPSIILFDTAQVYYQFQKPNELKGSSIQFMTDRLPAPALNPSAFIKPYGLFPDTSGSARHLLLTDEANSIAEMARVKTLENVTVTSRGKTPVQQLDEKYASGMFSGGDGYQFDLVNDPVASAAMNIFTYLQGKVAGLQITTNGSQTSMNWRGGAPQIYLDQMPVDVSFVQSLNVNDIAFVKVFRPPFMGGFNGANGAIAIYTRRGNDVKSEPGKGMANNKVFGYSPIKEFFAPNYASFTQRNEQRDLRTTLYWNPGLVTTPQNNKAVVIFYNNDVSGAFRVIIEGMTADGKLAHIEQIME